MHKAVLAIAILTYPEASFDCCPDSLNSLTVLCTRGAPSKKRHGVSRVELDMLPVG